MNRARALAISGLAIAAILVFASPSRFKETAMADTGPRTDIPLLKRLISLSEEPLEARFEVRPAPAKGEGALCAELVYPADAVRRILATSAVERPKGGMLDIAVPAWLAAPQSGIVTEGNGMQATDLPLHAPDPFLRSPYLRGFAFSPRPTTIIVCLAAT